MGLEELLNAAESIGMSREEFIGKIQKKYAIYVKKIAEKEPSTAVIALQSFEKLLEFTGIKPSENVVREAYTTYVRKGSLGHLGKLLELTGIKLPEDVVQEAYVTAVRCIQGAHGSWLIGRLLIELKEFQELTGIEPSLSERDVRGLYVTDIREVALDGLGKIRELIGIEPPEDIVQEAYAAYLGKADEYHTFKDYGGWFNNFEKLLEFSGIKPSENIVQEAYGNYVWRGQLDELEILQRMTKIKPLLPDNVVHRAYARYASIIQKSDSSQTSEEWLDKLNQLERITRIKPLQEVYKALINSPLLQ